MSVISYKCPHCDGELIFDPKTQNYKCEYCFSLFTQEDLNDMEQTEDPKGSGQQETQADEAQEGALYSCPSCGAQIVTDATTAAAFCYYCHNPVVLSGRLTGDYLPDKIIPFAIDKKTAVERFLEYVGKKKFVPKAFFQKQQIKLISGVYFPYWIYDTKMQTDMRAKGTKIRIWVAGDEEFTETKFYEVEREGEVTLDGMTENALKKASSQLSDGVLPYTLEEAKQFSFGYLSGFLAEKRDIESFEVKDAMEQEAKEYGEKLLRESIKGYNGVTEANINYHIEEDNYSYALLPVWTLTYRGKNGKMYYYSMNGQTGKVCGELPVDNKKVLFTCGALMLFVWLFMFLGGYFIW